MADEQLDKHLDAITEDEIRVGFRVKDVPEDLQRMLREAELPVFGTIRFSRLNPARRRKIAEAVALQYHKDLQNKAILSHDQLFRLNSERGEWTQEMEDQLDGLQEKLRHSMSEFMFEVGEMETGWTFKLSQKAADLRELLLKEFPNDSQVMTVFDRWVEYNPDRKDLYSERYVVELEGKEYSPARDFLYLKEHCPHMQAVEILDEIDALQDRIWRYLTYLDLQRQVIELQLKRARIFSQSVEARRDNAEQLARMYFTTERMENGKPVGLLTATFDQLWDFPDDVIKWLLEENWFFANGLPDEARKFYKALDFLGAERTRSEETSASGASEVSVESPVPPNSKDATTPSDKTPASSTA